MLNKNDKTKVLLPEEKIRARVQELGAQISRDYADLEEPLILLGILKGSFIFLADICRAISLPVEIEFMGVSSYGDATKSSGVVRITLDLTRAVRGRHVLVVEDIVDSGLTAKYLMENLATRQPASLRLCSLLEKPAKSGGNVKIDYLGFDIPDEFVLGYGLDFNGVYRSLPHVAVME